MTGKLYSILANFNGGTYIAQQWALKPSEAVSLWLDGLEEEEVSGLGSRMIEGLQLSDSLVEDLQVQIRGVESVWYFCLYPEEQMLEINVVQTVSAVNEKREYN